VSEEEHKHKHDRHHDHHKRVVHTHKKHINNLVLTGTHGPSVHHRHDAAAAQKPEVREPEGYVNVDVYLARAFRDGDNVPDDYTPPPTSYEQLIAGVNAGYLDGQPITVNVPYATNEQRDNLKSIDVFIALKGNMVGSNYRITDVIVDSTRKIAQGITLTNINNSEDYLTFPKEDDEDESPYLGYHNFEYDPDDGHLIGGEYTSDSPMYARIKPETPTIAPDDPSHHDTPDPNPVPNPNPDPNIVSDDSSIHGHAYPDRMPGDYPLDWLPVNTGTIDENHFVLFSFEVMDLIFSIDDEVDANGVKTGKHKITYHTKKAKK
jgi:hypothetical protein